MPGKPVERDIAILTRAIEKIFRKLIRMLLGKMSLKKLQEMIQIIFIEEAEAKLKKEAPGKSVALGDIALQTGVDTRTIKKIRKYIALSKPIHQDDTFLDGFMPLFKVFDLWMNDPRYFDAKSGKPRHLKIEGDGKKKGIRAYSDLCITKDDILSVYDKGDKVWDEKKIIDRTNSLATEILAIW